MDGELQAELTQAHAAVIAELTSATTELRAVLDAERMALDRRDSVALDAATAAKARLLCRLEALDVERRQLDDVDPARRAPGAWRQIRQQLEACRHINDINGNIVAHQLLDVRRSLGILRGLGEIPPVLYGPGGRAHAESSPRPLSQA